MTFRVAALTHCRQQQKMARVIPGAKPMAATLVAAVLFLAISAAALADQPGVDTPTDLVCDGVGPIHLKSARVWACVRRQ